MTQSVKCLLCKREDLSLVPRIHVKSWAWQHAPAIPVMGSQGQEDPRGLLANKPCIKWWSFLLKYIIKEGKKRGESLRGRGGLRERGKDRAGYFRISEELPIKTAEDPQLLPVLVAVRRQKKQNAPLFWLPFLRNQPSQKPAQHPGRLRHEAGITSPSPGWGVSQHFSLLVILCSIHSSFLLVKKEYMPRKHTNYVLPLPSNWRASWTWTGPFHKL